MGIKSFKFIPISADLIFFLFAGIVNNNYRKKNPPDGGFFIILKSI
jgi:hypothetical protein